MSAERESGWKAPPRFDDSPFGVLDDDEGFEASVYAEEALGRDRFATPPSYDSLAGHSEALCGSSPPVSRARFSVRRFFGSSSTNGKRPPPQFKSQILQMLSLLGVSVGTGNVWRFPRILAMSMSPRGAGMFLLLWLWFLFLWSIPIIITEYALGRYYRLSAPFAFHRVFGRKGLFMGSWVGLVNFIVSAYYAVVAGWSTYYFFHCCFYSLPSSNDEAFAVWNGLQNVWWPVLCQIFMLACCAFAILRGIRSLERLNMVLVPALIYILILIFVRSLTLGPKEGLKAFLFPDLDSLRRPEIWINALVQNAYDTGAGFGTQLAFGRFMREGTAIVRTGVLTPCLNNTVSILCGLTMFCTVFSLLSDSMSREDVIELMRNSGPGGTGLTYIWLPQLFERMSVGGRPLAALFFLALTFAALSSLAAQMEMSVQMIVDAGMKRRRALGLVVAGLFLLGLPSAIWDRFLQNQDFVWGSGLIFAGLFYSIVVNRTGPKRFRQTLINVTQRDNLGRWWDILMRFVIPVECFCIIGWWLVGDALSLTKNSEGVVWYSPTDPSLMSCVVQWGVGAFVLFLLAVGKRPWPCVSAWRACFRRRPKQRVLTAVAATTYGAWDAAAPPIGDVSAFQDADPDDVAPGLAVYGNSDGADDRGDGLGVSSDNSIEYWRQAAEEPFDDGSGAPLAISAGSEDPSGSS